MRTIAEIKQSMTAEFISNPSVIAKYELVEGKTFDEQFSKVSIESILFYVFAACAWFHESIVEKHKADVYNQIAEMKPHSLRWYRNKALAFQFGHALVFETDQYDNSNISETDIEKSKVVKYCAVRESKDASVLYIKIAGEDSSGKRTRITDDQENALNAYFQEVKDAGVYVQVVNRNADSLKIELTIYYDPMILKRDGNATDGTTEPVRAAVKSYVENLPFNGEYRNVDLIDVLQNVPGVIIPELISAQSKFGTNPYTDIDAKIQPDAGYFTFVSDDDLTINYVPNDETV